MKNFILLKNFTLFAGAVFLGLSSHAQTISTVVGNHTSGFSGDGGAATSAECQYIYGLAIDDSNNIYVADGPNHRIRKVSATTGYITTIVGSGTDGYSGDGGDALSAALIRPTDVALDADGNIYFTDDSTHTVRKVTISTNIITTIAGNGTAGYSGDGGLGSSAEINHPYGLAVDASYNVYIADYYNNCIRKVDGSTGYISTIAGNGTAGFSGDGGLASACEMNSPTDVTLDASGNIYIADEVNNRIRKIDASTGYISTVAGNGTAGSSGDGGLATSAELYFPYGITLDASGNMYIADYVNNKVRKVDASTGDISTIAGNGTLGYSGDGGAATSAELYYPLKTRLDGYGNVYIADAYNNVVRKISYACSSVSVGTLSSSAGTSFCGSGSTTLSISGTSTGTGISYQWEASTDGTTWTNVGTDSTNYTTGTFSTTMYYKVIVTCSSAGVSDSASITLTVSPTVTPTISISATATTICAGTSVTFTATTTNGGATPHYQWKKDGAVVGTDAATYTDASLANGDSVTCTLTSDAACASPSVVTSSSITMTVNPLLVPTITMSAAPGDTICDGTPVMFTASTTNGGSSPVFQWMKDGTIVGTGDSSYTDASLVSGDYITCTLTSDALCASPSSVTSGTVTIYVRPTLTAYVHITADPGDTVCDGGGASFNASTINGGPTPHFQWQKNGVNVGTDDSTYSYAGVASGDMIDCILTSDATCIGTPTTISETITMGTKVSAPPVITITAHPSTDVYYGEPVHFTTDVINGGSDPTFQWKKNGTDVVGATLSAFTDIFVSEDTITCEVHSTAPCADPDSALSNALVLSLSVGIKNVTEPEAISIYPNPNTGEFEVQCAVNNEKTVEIKITNVVGQLVYSETASVSNGLLKERLILPSAISSGVYLLHINAGSYTYVKRFVISQ